MVCRSDPDLNTEEIQEEILHYKLTINTDVNNNYHDYSASWKSTEYRVYNINDFKY